MVRLFINKFIGNHNFLNTIKSANLISFLTLSKSEIAPLQLNRHSKFDFVEKILKSTYYRL